MNVKHDIEQHASADDKPILRWLFERYHTQHEWLVVAHCSFKRYGQRSYETNRVWTPTAVGLTLYRYATEYNHD